MRWPSSFSFTLLSQVLLVSTTTAAGDSSPRANNNIAHPSNNFVGRSFIQRQTFIASSSQSLSSSFSSSSSWNAIPRGGGESDDPSSSQDNNLMNSLLSGMNLPGLGSKKMLDDLMSQPPPSPEQIQQSMEQLTSLLSSPQFKDMLNDPTKMEATLETMRNSLLTALEEMEKGDNPMMKIMLEQMRVQLAQSFPGGWDGLKELIEDADKWKEMMGGLMEVMKSLGDEDWSKIMSQMMMGGMGGGAGGMGDIMSGMGGGNTLGDAFGSDNSGTLAGLDDLSEGED